ncbi:MAG: urea ABC transporter permease subunit UrtB [Gammaproteobacteria bacterium]|nr:MAG: urea ABC transporter permease subunit UrtB [Gammaproteobacteria bacterium]
MTAVKFAKHQRCLASILLVLLTGKAWALDAASLNTLAAGEVNKKIAVVEQLVNAGDAAALPVLEALSTGTLYTTETGAVVIVTPAAALDALTGKPAAVEPLEKISINNRLRQHLNTAIAALRLAAPDRALRLAAAMELQKSAGDALLPLIERRLQQEQDAEIKSLLRNVQANLRLRAPERELRLQAVKDLARNPSNHIKSLLLARIENGADGKPAEPDAEVRQAIHSAVAAIDRELKKVEYLSHLFSGLSLGSILLLAALGLAITFGLMGIINMAHGELLMIGAYATYVVQILFKHYWPGAFDGYLLAAVPVSFITAALVGMALERSVIRHLYGRPLETLLATWGISLLLIQTVRVMFGAQNVAVDNPSWMSGAWTVTPGLVLPYNRIAIIFFALFVVALVWVLLNRTRLGLYLRAVTQNRNMAACMGIPTPKVDLLAFGLGSGIAGLGGCALSQIGNVGPELGQSYIVDSFMVVVLGGVGQLAGTIVAALGLGEINKFLEPYAGAVLGKIIILVMIIIFIQKRPQGLFALKGRSAES